MPLDFNYNHALTHFTRMQNICLDDYRLQLPRFEEDVAKSLMLMPNRQLYESIELTRDADKQWTLRIEAALRWLNYFIVPVEIGEAHRFTHRSHGVFHVLKSPTLDMAEYPASELAQYNHPSPFVLAQARAVASFAYLTRYMTPARSRTLWSRRPAAREYGGWTQMALEDLVNAVLLAGHAARVGFYAPAVGLTACALVTLARALGVDFAAREYEFLWPLLELERDGGMRACMVELERPTRMVKSCDGQLILVEYGPPDTVDIGPLAASKLRDLLVGGLGIWRYDTDKVWT